MDFKSILATVAQEFQPALIAVQAAEQLADKNATSADKQNAANNLAQDILAGWAIAQPAKAPTLQAAAQLLPTAINTFVGIFNLFGVFKHKSK